MIKFESINSREMIVKEAMSLGDFVDMYKNGKLVEILDMKYGIGLNNLLSIQEDSILFASKSGDTISILFDNGNIIEFIKSNKRYMAKDDILAMLRNQYNRKYVRCIQSYIKGSTNHGNKFFGDLSVGIDFVIDNINNIYDLFPAFELPYTVEKERIYFEGELYDGPSYYTDENGNESYIGDQLLCSLELIFGDTVYIRDTVKDAVKENKIISCNKFKQHMSVHQNDFRVQYDNLTKYMQSKGYFNNLKDGFVEMVIELPFNIGYKSIVETNDTHEIVYAKRNGRDIFSRITLSGEKMLTNKCVVILNQSYTNPNEYYLVSMFPGEHLIREVQDKNIKSKEERKRVLEFWKGHALIVNPTEIDCSTITKECPYTEAV
ncbi:hypothetical protein [Candidatus Clostridium radicumherbarum]|uniref:Uncharacterized protein n=1 Tax=Candidatus Clostridium radicumherbarum TaxID=3381662 RepID=A0ABW8TWJ8_9CLOT